MKTPEGKLSEELIRDLFQEIHDAKDIEDIKKVLESLVLLID